MLANDGNGKIHVWKKYGGIGKVCMDFALIANILFSTEVNFNLSISCHSLHRSRTLKLFMFLSRVFFFCFVLLRVKWNEIISRNPLNRICKRFELFNHTWPWPCQLRFRDADSERFYSKNVNVVACNALVSSRTANVAYNFSRWIEYSDGIKWNQKSYEPTAIAIVLVRNWA